MKLDLIRVKQRQLKKFQNLVNRKEGNITRVSNNNSPQVGNNLAANRQAGTHLPSGEGSNTPQASPLLSPGEGDSPRVSQAGLGTHLLTGEDSNSSPQATAHLPPREGSSSPQATAHLPPGEGSTISQGIAHLPPREGSNSSQATAHLPSREGSSTSQATAHLPSREGSSTSQVATTHLPPREAGSSPQATAHLPSREGSSTSQATAHLSPREASGSSSQATTHPSPEEGSSNSQAGQTGNQLGQAGRASGILPDIGHPRLLRRIALPPRQTALTPRMATPLLPPPVGFPKGLLMKTLS